VARSRTNHALRACFDPPYFKLKIWSKLPNPILTKLTLPNYASLIDQAKCSNMAEHISGLPWAKRCYVVMSTSKMSKKLTVSTYVHMEVSVEGYTDLSFQQIREKSKHCMACRQCDQIGWNSVLGGNTKFVSNRQEISD
jgi:hypothetical protein